MEEKLLDKAVPQEISALLSGERLKLRETHRAVTPLGGVVVFVEYLNRIGLSVEFRRHMPVRYRSRNQIDPSTTLICFLVSVLAAPEDSRMPPGCAGTRRCMRCSA